VTSFPSLYRAQAVSIKSGAVEAFVPQVFGETTITVTDALGTLPDAPTMGWVFFQAGNCEFPVWSSGLGVGNGNGDGDGNGDGGGGDGGGGDVAVDEVWIGPEAPSGPQELWFDPDAPVSGMHDETHWNSAWGLVALGTFSLGGGFPLPVNSDTRVTDKLPFTSVVGRRYVIHLIMRVTISPSQGSIRWQPHGDGLPAAIDGWTGTNSTYSSCNLEFGFVGTGNYSEYFWTAGPGALVNTQVWSDVYSSFYIEDVGPTVGSIPIANPNPPPFWQALSLGGTWNGSGSYAQWRMLGDMVQLRGYVSFLASGGNPMVTLPVGVRPPRTTHFLVPSMEETPRPLRMQIETSGAVGIFGLVAAMNFAFEIQFSVTP